MAPRGIGGARSSPDACKSPDAEDSDPQLQVRQLDGLLPMLRLEEAVLLKSKFGVYTCTCCLLLDSLQSQLKFCISPLFGYEEAYLSSGLSGVNSLGSLGVEEGAIVDSLTSSATFFNTCLWVTAVCMQREVGRLLPAAAVSP